MKQLFRFLFMVLSIFSFSCSSNDSTLGLLGSTGDIRYEADEILYEQLSMDVNQADDGKNLEEQTPRKVIKEGDIRFETYQPESFTAVLKEKVKSYRGYVSNETTYNYYDRNEYNVTIRVPAQNFDTLVSWISNREGKIESKNIRVMDVTETFIDLESRIKTKKELEERYKELLKQAKTVKEILEIEQQIGYLRAEIESFEGRFKYLGDRIAYSTLSLVYYERVERERGSGQGYGSKIIKALERGWNFMLTLIIGIISIWPIWIIIAIPLIIVYRRKRRRKK